MRHSGAPDTIGALVACKDRRNALKNPYAHLHEHGITLEMVVASPMLGDRIRYSETCPSSDGACAMVLTDRAGATRAPRPPAITDPRRDIDAVEMHVPFSWYEPMRLENLGFTAPGEGS